MKVLASLDIVECSYFCRNCHSHCLSHHEHLFGARRWHRFLFEKAPNMSELSPGELKSPSKDLDSA